MGRRIFGLGDYDEAIAAYKKVVEIEPDNGDGWNNLGATYLQTARFEESIPVFQKANALLPTADTYTNLGIAYTSLGRYADAVPAYEKAVELNPNARAFVGNLADGYRWAGDAEKARATYDKAIALAYNELEVNPRNAETKANLALYYAKRGDIAQASRLIADARAIDASNVEIMYMEATVHLFANRRSEALAQLREAFRAGYPASFAKTDPDLKPLWTDAQFQRLVKEFEGKWNPGRGSAPPPPPQAATPARPVPSRRSVAGSGTTRVLVDVDDANPAGEIAVIGVHDELEKRGDRNATHATRSMPHVKQSMKFPSLLKNRKAGPNRLTLAEAYRRCCRRRPTVQRFRWMGRDGSARSAPRRIWKSMEKIRTTQLFSNSASGSSGSQAACHAFPRSPSQTEVLPPPPRTAIVCA